MMGGWGQREGERVRETEKETEKEKRERCTSIPGIEDTEGSVY